MFSTFLEVLSDQEYGSDALICSLLPYIILDEQFGLSAYCMCCICIELTS